MQKPDFMIHIKPKKGIWILSLIWLFALFISTPIFSVQALIPTIVPTVWSNSLFSMSSNPDSIKAGDTFDLNIKIETDAPTRGAEIALIFDPKLVEILEAKEGNFYKDFAASSGASTLMMPPQLIIDNTKGSVGGMSITVMGGAQSGPQGQKGNGVFLTYKVKAKANGSAKFSLVDVKLWDAKAEGRPQMFEGVKSQDFTVMIGGGSSVQSTPQAAIPPGQNAAPAATAVRRATATPASFDSGGGSSTFPTWIIIPIAGTGLLGAVLVFVTRKKK